MQSRPVPWRMPHQTFAHDVAVQYRDLDPRSHVNHAHYVSYLEEGKAALFREEVGVSLADAGTAIRSLDVDYLRPVEADQTVTVFLGPVELGSSSFTIDYEVLVDGETAATATTVSVLVDEGGAVALPEEWREALAPFTAAE